MDGFGVNYDGRSKIMPRGIVKANAVVDNDYLKDARSRLRNATGSVAFTGNGLTIEGNEMFKIYNDEPILIHRGRAALHHATGKQNQPFQRSDAMWETRIPVVGTLNGALGKTKHDILDQFAAFGVAENADRLGQTNALNAVMGGFFTVPNGPYAMIAGDMVMIDCPDPANPASFPTRAVAGNIANRGGQNGRIPLYYAPYRPFEVSWYNPDAVRDAIKRTYEEVKGDVGGKKTDKLWIKTVGGPNPYTGMNQSYLAHQFTIAVREQVEALTRIIQVAGCMNGVEDGNTTFTPKGGAGGRGVTKPGAYKAAADPISEHIARDAAIRIMLASGRFGDTRTWAGDNLPANTTGKVDAILGKFNPFQQSMRAQSQFRLKVEEWVIGRAVTGAAPYNDFDLHMRAFGR